MSVALALVLAALVGVPERPPIVSFQNREVRHEKFDHGFIYPAMPASVTMVADLTVVSLPQKGVGTIFGRRGWHNRLCVDSSGRLDWGCFAWDGKRSANVKSDTRLVPGKTYRLAGVLDCSQGNETRLRLYVDGREEGRSAVFEGAPWNYPWCVEVGQIGWSADGNHKDPSDCVFRNFWYFYKPLTGEEIKGL